NATFWSLEPLLAFPTFRTFVMEHTRNQSAKDFWQELRQWERNPKFLTEALAPVKNKMAMFFGNPLIRNVFAQTTSTINLPSLMQSYKIIIINLAQSALAFPKARLVGNLLLAH